jgi:hypothetical protein
VEKKLLDVYREEAAYLLRLAYFELSDDAGLEHNHGLVYTAPTLIPAKRGVETLGRLISSKKPFLGSDAPAVAVIEEGAGTLTNSPLNLVQLVQCSLRLAWSQSAQSYLGAEFMIAGDLVAGRNAYEELLLSPMPAENRASHLTALATIQLLARNQQSGQHAYESAAALSPGNASAAFSWLWTSLLLDDREAAIRASVHVDQFWPSPSTALSSWLVHIRGQRKHRAPSLGHPDISFVTKLRDRLGYSSGSIVDEALE